MSTAPVSGPDADNSVNRGVNLDVSWEQNIDGLILPSLWNVPMLREPPAELDRKVRAGNLEWKWSFDSSHGWTLSGPIWNDPVVHEPPAEFDHEGQASNLDKQLSFHSSHGLTLSDPKWDDPMTSDLHSELDHQGQTEKLVKRLSFGSSQEGKVKVDIDGGHRSLLNSAWKLSTLWWRKGRAVGGTDIVEAWLSQNASAIVTSIFQYRMGSS